MIQRAVDITAVGFAAVMQSIRPGQNEFDVQESLEHAYRTNGSVDVDSWRSGVANWVRNVPAPPDAGVTVIVGDDAVLVAVDGVVAGAVSREPGTAVWVESGADALVDQLARAYPEGLRIVHRTLSRERSSFYNSRGGAEAAICGDRLGAFRKLHELLLKNQRSLAPDALAEYAAAAGLDRARFGECLGEPETRDRLAADVAALNQLGITEAPAYLINGRLVQGSKPLPVLMGLIEAERRRHRL